MENQKQYTKAKDFDQTAKVLFIAIYIYESHGLTIFGKNDKIFTRKGKGEPPMASEQTVVLHSQERPVYINKGSALTQNLIFSAALAGAGTYGLLALQHTLRTGSQWVDATAPNGYSLYQFAYGVIGSVIQNFKIDKAMAALLGKAYDFDRFCRIGGGLLLASLISIAAVLLVTVVYNIVNLAYLHRVNKMEKAEVPTLEEARVQRWNRALPVIHRVYAALSYLSLLICLSSVFPLSMISGAALGAKTAGDSATASSIAARAKIAIVIGFVLFFIIAVRGITKKWDRIKANGPLVCPENLGTYLHGLVIVSVPFLTVLALALLIVILLAHLMLTGTRLTRRD